MSQKILRTMQDDLKEVKDKKSGKIPPKANEPQKKEDPAPKAAPQAMKANAPVIAPKTKMPAQNVSAKPEKEQFKDIKDNLEKKGFLVSVSPLPDGKKKEDKGKDFFAKLQEKIARKKKGLKGEDALASKKQPFFAKPGTIANPKMAAPAAKDITKQDLPDNLSKDPKPLPQQPAPKSEEEELKEDILKEVHKEKESILSQFKAQEEARKLELKKAQEELKRQEALRIEEARKANEAMQAQEAKLADALREVSESLSEEETKAEESKKAILEETKARILEEEKKNKEDILAQIRKQEEARRLEMERAQEELKRQETLRAQEARMTQQALKEENLKREQEAAKLQEAIQAQETEIAELIKKTDEVPSKEDLVETMRIKILEEEKKNKEDILRQMKAQETQLADFIKQVSTTLRENADTKETIEQEILSKLAEEGKKKETEEEKRIALLQATIQEKDKQISNLLKGISDSLQEENESNEAKQKLIEEMKTKIAQLEEEKKRQEMLLQETEEQREQKRAEEERKAAEEAERSRQEEEAKRLAEEARQAAEAEARRQEEERQRLQAEEEERLKREEEERQAAEAERLRQAEEERKREEARQATEEAERLRQEEEAKRLAEEARQAAEEAERSKQEAERKEAEESLKRLSSTPIAAASPSATQIGVEAKPTDANDAFWNAIRRNQGPSNNAPAAVSPADSPAATAGAPIAATPETEPDKKDTEITDLIKRVSASMENPVKTAPVPAASEAAKPDKDKELKELLSRMSQNMEQQKQESSKVNSGISYEEYVKKTAPTITTAAPLEEAEDSYWTKIHDTLKEPAISPEQRLMGGTSIGYSPYDQKTDASSSDGQTGLVMPDTIKTAQQRLQERRVAQTSYSNPENRLIQDKQEFYSTMHKSIKPKTREESLEGLDSILKEEQAQLSEAEEKKKLRENIIAKYGIKIFQFPWLKVILVSVLFLAIVGGTMLIVLPKLKSPVKQTQTITVGKSIAGIDQLIFSEATAKKNQVTSLNYFDANLAPWKSFDDGAVIRLNINYDSEDLMLSRDEALKAVLGETNFDNMPDEFINAISTEYNVLVFKENGSVRLGLAFQYNSSKQEEFKDIMTRWEQTATRSKKIYVIMKNLFVNSRIVEQDSATFQPATYNETELRFVNLPDSETSMDYFLYDGYVIFTSSKDHTFQMIDLLKS